MLGEGVVLHALFDFKALGQVAFKLRDRFVNVSWHKSIAIMDDALNESNPMLKVVNALPISISTVNDRRRTRGARHPPSSGFWDVLECRVHFADAEKREDRRQLPPGRLPADQSLGHAAGLNANLG
jgi:hypothetical protein